VHGFGKGDCAVERRGEGVDGDAQIEFGRQTPAATSDMKTRLVNVKGRTPNRWRKSMS
jgi:hypothetical protein